jgi:probable addiction module antidote protein
MAKEKIKIGDFDILDYLKTERDIAGFLDAALENGDYEHFLRAIGIAAKARGINEMAQKIGVAREGLYKSFNGKSRPNFETVIRAVGDLGLRVRIEPRF